LFKKEQNAIENYQYTFCRSRNRIKIIVLAAYDVINCKSVKYWATYRDEELNCSVFDLQEYESRKNGKFYNSKEAEKIETCTFILFGDCIKCNICNKRQKDVQKNYP
jgi:hypothetical protein